MRHWVCTLAWGIRALFGYDKQRCAAAFVKECIRSQTARQNVPRTRAYARLSPRPSPPFNALTPPSTQRPLHPKSIFAHRVPSCANNPGGAAMRPSGSLIFFRHFALALIAVAWGMCCTGLGFWLVERVLPAIALGTKFTLAFPLGVVLFGTAVAVAGFMGGLGTTFYWALLAVGLASSFQPMVRLVRVLSRLRLRVNSAPSKTTNALLVAAATLALALVCVPTLTPRHLSYDTLWHHLTVAEHYVAAGGIERLDEGWLLGLYPQLASWLYTWALLTPLLGVVDRSLLCMQMEFVIFLGTLATIPSLARAILRSWNHTAPAAALELGGHIRVSVGVPLRPCCSSRPRVRAVCRSSSSGSAQSLEQPNAGMLAATGGVPFGWNVVQVQCGDLVCSRGVDVAGPLLRGNGARTEHGGSCRVAQQCALVPWHRNRAYELSLGQELALVWFPVLSDAQRSLYANALARSRIGGLSRLDCWSYYGSQEWPGRLLADDG